MTQWAIFIQEGFGSDGQHIFFTSEPPRYEALNVPIFATTDDTGNEIIGQAPVHVGDREEMFIVFTPVNGPSKRRGKPNRVPFQRVLSVIAQENEEEE